MNFLIKEIKLKKLKMSGVNLKKQQINNHLTPEKGSKKTKKTFVIFFKNPYPSLEYFTVSNFLCNIFLSILQKMAFKLKIY